MTQDIIILEVGLQNLEVAKALTIGSDRNCSVASSAIKDIY